MFDPTETKVRRSDIPTQWPPEDKANGHQIGLAAEGRPEMTKAEAQAMYEAQVEAAIRALFSYKAPTHITLPKYQILRAQFANLAVLVHQTCPPGPDREEAMKLLRQSMMMANSSIANGF